jgi:enoyl-[acyl-carrier protein] reductase II
MSPFVKEVMQVVIDERVAVVTTGAGNPGEYLPALKEIGTKVIPVVASVALAKRLTRIGADAVIAEGTESGGHIGEITTMALLPQVVDAVDVPVIGAGGIGDSRGMAAAFALGAGPRSRASAAPLAHASGRVRRGANAVARLGSAARIEIGERGIRTGRARGHGAKIP